MKKILSLIFFFFIIYIQGAYSQAGNKARVYLLTCGPGTETYAIYGHSAIRIVFPDEKTDIVFNWGVFDFSTPNFAWKFAKGRLDYMVISESLETFLEMYIYEERYVKSQRVNLNNEETERLIALINENLKPENSKYKYDFFYDDCSTRIRDLLEKAIGDKLLYPPEESSDAPTFREMTGKYQDQKPWLKFGIDLIMGSPGDKKTTFRDMMFLPIDLQNCLSEAVIKRDGKMIPLLQNPEILLDFDPPSQKGKSLTDPVNIFAMLLIALIIFMALIKRRRIITIIDIVIFFLFSVLSVLMIFFNFFTDHQQMKMNLNILWLNPFIFICFASFILGWPGIKWFRIVFFTSVTFLIIHVLLPQSFGIAVLPLILLLALRSSARSGFTWNPFSIR